MAICNGHKKSAALCHSTVNGCTRCTNVGCDQDEAGQCSNQGFHSGICLNCGAPKREQDTLAMTPQLQEAIKIVRMSPEQLQEAIKVQLVSRRRS